MSRRLQILLYALFGVFALVVAAFFTFPWDVLGRRIEAEAAKAVPGATLVVNEVGPALPVGLRLAGLVWQGPSQGTEPGLKVEVQRVRARPALLRLLTGKLGAGFDVQALGGEVTGQVLTAKSGALSLDARLRGMQLDDGGTLERATGLKLGGQVDGRVHLSRDEKGVVTAGQIAGSINGALMKGGKVMGFTLPPLDLGAPEIQVAIENGEAKIEKFTTRSPDVELDVTGTVSLRPNLAQSLVKGSIKLRLTDAWLARNPDIKGMLAFAGPLKKADGSLEIPLNGPLHRAVSIPGF